MADLTRGDLHRDPIEQFRDWFREALEAELIEPTAMTLATVDRDGRPSARIVLLKDVKDSGFVFFTNYESRKGRELEARADAALCLWWPPLGRQVRVEGRTERLAATESDAYFASRPRESQLGAAASDQSRALASRADLEERLRAVDQTYRDRPVARPPHWGGFLLQPRAVEFWQQGAHRLHDRFRYERAGADWSVQRLAP